MFQAFTRPAIIRLGLALAALLVLAAGAQAEEPFYKGKRLTVLINFAAGGPTDIEGRLFAKYLVKHIDGQPGVIVQNMDGAGGLIGAQYLGEVAPKDGTVLGYLSGSAWLYVSDPDRWRVDFRKYEFVAYQPGTTVHFMRTDVAPGMHVPADIAKAQGPDRRRPERRHLEGSAVAARARHAGRAVQIRHRLSLEPAGAARAPARRDLHVLGIAAELPLRGRALAGQDRAGDAGVLRRGRRPAAAAKAAGGPVDPELSAALSPDQRHAAVRPAVGGLSGALRHELDPAADDRAAARHAAGRARGAALRRSRASTTTRTSPPRPSKQSSSRPTTRPLPT